MAAPELIIFDCDGVLIDSEIIAAQVESELLTSVGYQIGPKDVATRFSGLTWPNILMILEHETGISISASLIEESNRILDDRLAKDVLAIDGIQHAISTLHYPKCICSNSSSTRLEMMLTRTGLYDLFSPAIFSAREVGTKKDKPDPNVFLHAAETFSINPHNALVIEDSVHGISAALAAGMRVVGFIGGSHTYPAHADCLIQAGAEIIVNHHRNLPALIKTLEM